MCMYAYISYEYSRQVCQYVHVKYEEHVSSIVNLYSLTHEIRCGQSKPLKRQTPVLGWLAFISVVYA